MEEPNRIQGFRKMGITMGAITALSIIDSIEFKIAVLITVIAIAGIICQGILDYKK